MMRRGCVLLPRNSLGRKGAAYRNMYTKRHYTSRNVGEDKQRKSCRPVCFEPPGQMEKSIGELPKVQTSIPAVSCHGPGF